MYSNYTFFKHFSIDNNIFLILLSFIHRFFLRVLLLLDDVVAFALLLLGCCRCWLILKRYHPVALQISKHTLELYHSKSKDTKICKNRSIRLDRQYKKVDFLAYQTKPKKCTLREFCTQKLINEESGRSKESTI